VTLHAHDQAEVDESQDEIKSMGSQMNTTANKIKLKCLPPELNLC